MSKTELREPSTSSPLAICVPYTPTPTADLLTTGRPAHHPASGPRLRRLSSEPAGSGSIRPSTSSDAILNPLLALPVDASLGRTYIGGSGTPGMMIAPLAPALSVWGDGGMLALARGLSRRAARGSEYNEGRLGGLGRSVLSPVALPVLGSRLREPIPRPCSDARNVSFISRRRSSTALSVASTGPEYGVESVRGREPEPEPDAGASFEWAELDSSVMVASRACPCEGPAGLSEPSRLLGSGLRASMSWTNAEMSSSSVFVLRYDVAWKQRHDR